MFATLSPVWRTSPSSGIYHRDRSSPGTPWSLEKGVLSDIWYPQSSEAKSYRRMHSRYQDRVYTRKCRRDRPFSSILNREPETAFSPRKCHDTIISINRSRRKTSRDSHARKSESPYHGMVMGRTSVARRNRSVFLTGEYTLPHHRTRQAELEWKSICPGDRERYHSRHTIAPRYKIYHVHDIIPRIFLSGKALGWIIAYSQRYVSGFLHRKEDSFFHVRTPHTLYGLCFPFLSFTPYHSMRDTALLDPEINSGWHNKNVFYSKLTCIRVIISTASSWTCFRIFIFSSNDQYQQMLLYKLKYYMIEWVAISVFSLFRVGRKNGKESIITIDSLFKMEDVW